MAYHHRHLSKTSPKRCLRLPPGNLVFMLLGLCLLIGMTGCGSESQYASAPKADESGNTKGKVSSSASSSAAVTKNSGAVQNSVAGGNASAIEDPVVARINGEPILRSELLAVLLPGHGKKVLEDLSLVKIVRRYAETKGVHATPEMITAERRSILQDMAPGKTPAQQDSLLDYLLESRGLSEAQFNLIIEKQALLRQLVDRKVEVSESMIRAEYDREHGRRVQIRLLAATSDLKVQEAKRQLSLGVDFIEMIRTTSEDQRTVSRDGLLGPFPCGDEAIAVMIRQASCKLSRIGDYSELFQYNDEKGLDWYGICRLERVIPADGTAIESVRDELSESIRERTVRQRMLELQQSLKNSAEVQIIEPRLLPKKK